MNIDMKALKGVIEEIEASKVRQKGEAEFQREAIKRAVKHHQLDGKAIRIVLQRRAMGDEKRDEQDYYVHAYEMALGGKKLAADALAGGATIREAAAIGGISTGAAGNLAKVVQKSSKMDKTEYGDDGITGGEDGKAEVDHGAGKEAYIRRQPNAKDAVGHERGDGALGAGRDDHREDGGGLRGIGAAQAQLNEAPATPSVGAVAAEPRVAPQTDLEMPPIPSHLRSRTAQGRVGHE